MGFQSCFDTKYAPPDNPGACMAASTSRRETECVRKLQREKDIWESNRVDMQVDGTWEPPHVCRELLSHQSCRWHSHVASSDPS